MVPRNINSCCADNVTLLLPDVVSSGAYIHTYSDGCGCLLLRVQPYTCRTPLLV